MASDLKQVRKQRLLRGWMIEARLSQVFFPGRTIIQTGKVATATENPKLATLNSILAR
ncbi:MAG: hypothetical protein ACC657_18520 [Thiohalomonadales bacterium]